MNTAEVPPERRFLLHERAGESLPRQAQRGLHPGEAAADDEGPVRYPHGRLVEGPDEARLGNHHAEQIFRLGRRLPGKLHMHPGALIADVGHLEEVLVEARLPDRLLEQGLVGARRTGGNHHAVESVLVDRLLHLFLGILRAGVEVLIHVHHAGKRSGVLCYAGNIDDPADIDPAVADEDADPGRLPRHVAFGRVLLRPGERPARLREKSRCRFRRRAGLDDRFRDVLGALKHAAGENAFTRGGERRKPIGPAEPVVSQAICPASRQVRGSPGPASCRRKGRPGRTPRRRAFRRRRCNR